MIIHLLKKSAISVLGLVMILSTLSNAQVTLPRAASPAAEVSQIIGISKVTINYSRPSVRGRAIWGALVPYGYNYLGFGTSQAAPWRAGANENTTIAFSHDAEVEGKSIPAGTYGLHVALYENGEADIIFSKNYTSWGSFFYNQDEDQLRVKVQTKEIPETELLTYNFINIDNSSAILALDWEKRRIPFKVSFDVPDIILSNARNELRSTQGFNWQGPLSAANYCLQNNINHEEALQWADQAIAGEKNFNTLFVKGALLEQTGAKEKALPLYDEAAKVANNPQLNFLGYQLMGLGNNDKALEFFKLNVERNPDDANVHDSLGEFYKTTGDNKNAIKEFKKSLSLNPIPAVKANSIKHLKDLGVDTSSYESGD